MTTFAYTALEPSGKRKTGFIDAATKEAAIAVVAADGKYVLEIKESGGSGEKSAFSLGKSKKVSKADIALFTRRMADLADAGLPLDRVLQVVAEQAESETLQEVALDALDQVRKGTPVSEALARHPKLFPDVFTQTLRAGEASGQFADVAGRLAEFQEKEVTRRSQIVSALIYPGVLTFTAIGVVLALVFFVMPKLSPVFKDLGTELPLTTKILLGTTDFLTKNGLFLLGGIIALFFAYKAWVKTEAGALARDRMIFRMPVVGSVIRKATVSRFARVLGTLVFGGVAILEAIRIAGLSSGNKVFIASSAVVESEVREGKPIAEAMRDAGDFPPVLTHMVAIGEETGDLPKMLGRVSESLDFEVDNGMRRLVALVEPMIVLGMGGIVGFVVLSVLLPIFAAQSAVK
ncbi:MAG: type II secretion system F family protein [Chlorobia bacterium]|nr:type II secretion system F family protein [Fimbriimonadaceae bacterium]